MNFNGQLKKRTVNPGGGFRQNRTALLQQTQREREKREKERDKERAVRAIVGALSNRLELLRWKKEIGQSWQPQGDVNSVVHVFTLFYGDTFKVNENRLLQLKQLFDVVEGTIDEITSSNCVRIVKTVRDALVKVDLKDEDGVGITVLLLRLAVALPAKVVLIPTLGRVLSALDSSKASLLELVAQAINTYASYEPQNYLDFLSGGFIKEIPFEINYAALSIESPTTLSIDQKLQLLVNCVDKCTEYSTYFFTAIACIVSSFDVSLVTVTESMTEDEEHEGSRYKQKLITEGTEHSIQKLYTREFITRASAMVKDHNTLTRLFGSLIVLRPTMKSSFIIYLIPTGFQPLLNQILRHDIFNKLTHIDENALFNAPVSFNKAVFADSLEFLHYDLFVFLELLQYRLIISNDHEIFLSYDFLREKFSAFAMFLKKFVFNLIWNHASILNYTQSKRTEMLSELAISVLSQIYLKDSRLHILEKGAWLLDANRLNLGNLITIIAQYEEKKNDVSNDSDGEGEAFLQSLNPDMHAKLQIYQRVPFFISFEKRVEIFQGLVDIDRARLGLGEGNRNFFASFLEPKHTAVIRREHLLDDAYDSFNKLGEQFKTRLGIEFHNQHGREEGIDGGGITKEFLTSVVSEGFQEPLFVENGRHELYPNPMIGLKYQHRIESSKQLEHLNYINFMGKVLGKCLYERVLVDVAFATFFLTKFNTGYKNSFDDLISLDAELYANLVKLLTLSESDLANLGLTFSLDERIGKKNHTVDLIPGGSLIPVTTSNRLKFIHEMSNYKLNKMVMMQCSSFLKGLYEIIHKDWLAMFNPYELQLLISGESDVNIADLRANCVYGGFSDDDQTMRDLWEVVGEMESSDKFQFVKFVTSVPRAPLLGFKALVPLFGIRNTGSDVDRLPTSSTCVNLLKLPNYRDKGVLREKLLYAINAEAGFDLT